MNHTGALGVESRLRTYHWATGGLFVVLGWALYMYSAQFLEGLGYAPTVVHRDIDRE